MPATVRCPNPDCGKEVAVLDPNAGVSCPSCGKVIPRRRSTSKVGNTPGSEHVTQAPIPQLPTGDLPKSLGRFELKAFLGQGGFGQVWRAWDPRLRREVALKVPVADRMRDPKMVKRFFQEAIAAARLHHPHIVPVHDAAQDASTGVCYIALEFIHGRTLEDELEQTKQGGERFPLDRAVQLVREMAEGLAYAHAQGVVHRDIKPSNTMVDRDGHAHLMDFGLAQIEESTSKLTQDGARMGTLAYMSPEQARGDAKEKIGPASDQYSLGITFYQLLTGEVPFAEARKEAIPLLHINREPDTPRKNRSDVPRDLETICLKTLAKRPEDRYATCQDLADDLRRWQEGEPIKARRLNSFQRAWRWCKREPKMAAMLFLVMCCLVAVAWIFHDAAQNEKHQRLQVDQERNSALRRLTENYLDRGLALCQQNQVDDGLLWIVRGLENTPEGATDLDTTGRRLLAGWTNNLPRLSSALRVSQRVQRLEFSADGQILAVVTDGKDEAAREIRLYRAASGELVCGPIALGRFPFAFLRQTRVFRDFPGHSDLLLSPDGRRFVNNPGDGLALWDVTANPVRRVAVLGGAISNVAYSFDGKTLGVVKMPKDGNAGEVCLLDSETGAPIWTVPDTWPTVTLAFAADGRTLALVGFGRLRLWDIGTKRPIGDPQEFGSSQAAAGALVEVAFLPQGSNVAAFSGVNRKCVQLFDAEGAHRAGAIELDQSSSIRRIHALPSSVMVFDHSGQMSQWSIPEGKRVGESKRWELSPPGREGPAGADDIRISASGTYLLALDGGNGAQLWNIATGKPTGSLSAPAKVRAVAISPDGRTLVCGDERGEVRLWQMSPWRTRQPSLKHDGGTPWLSPDGKSVVLSKLNTSVRLHSFSTESGEPNRKPADLPFRPSRPMFFVVSRDGGKAAIRDKTGMALFDLKADEPKPLRLALSQAVRTGEFNSDGSRFLTLAAPYGAGVANLWDAATGGPIGNAMQHEHGVRTAHFSPDGGSVVTVMAPFANFGQLKMWSSENGQEVFTRTFEHPITSVHFLPDGKSFIAVERKPQAARPFEPPLTPERRLQRLEAATGKPCSPSSLIKADYPLAFSPDGRFLLYSSDQSHATLWKIDSAQMAFPPIRVVGVPRQGIFSQSGRFFAVVSSFQGQDHVAFWDTSDGKPVGKPFSFPSEGSPKINISPDDKLAAISTYGEAKRAKLRLWDIANSSWHGGPFYPDKEIESQSFSKDSRILLLTSAGRVAVIDCATAPQTKGPGQFTKIVPVSSTLPFAAVHCNCAEPSFLALEDSSRHQCQLIDLEGRLVADLAVPQDAELLDVKFPVHGGIFGLFGKRSEMDRVGIAKESTFYVWDLKRGKLVGGELGFGLSSARLAPDGKTVVVQGSSVTATAEIVAVVSLWDCQTGKHLGGDVFPDVTLRNSVFSPDGATLALPRHDKSYRLTGRYRLWNVLTNKPISSESFETKAIAPIVFSPDGKMLLTATTERDVQAWDVTTGQPMDKSLPSGTVGGPLSFSPDGAYFLVGYGRREVQAWHTSSWKPAGFALRHHAPVLRGVLETSGKIVGTTHLWELASGKQLGPAPPGDAPGPLACMHPDGRAWLGVTDDTASYYRVPEPLSGDIERVRLWIQVLTGKELDEHGAVHVLDQHALQTRKRRLEELGGPPAP